MSKKGLPTGIRVMLICNAAVFIFIATTVEELVGVLLCLLLALSMASLLEIFR